MERLTDNFLASCPRDGGLILRGHKMTRIETFVDAAFAFSLTLLVISIDEIPRSPVQLVETARDIPAFVLSAWFMGQMWLVHVGWSRIFGLQDRTTVVISLAIVMLVLIFVYPLKLMFQSGIFYFSDGLLGANVFTDSAEWTTGNVADMFVFTAGVVLCLAFGVVALYLNGLHHRRQLRLTRYEIYLSWKRIVAAAVVGVTAVLCAVAARILTDDGESLPLAALGYFSLFATMPGVAWLYNIFYPPPAIDSPNGPGDQNS